MYIFTTEGEKYRERIKERDYAFDKKDIASSNMD